MMPSLLVKHDDALVLVFTLKAAAGIVELPLQLYLKKRREE